MSALLTGSVKPACAVGEGGRKHPADAATGRIGSGKGRFPRNHPSRPCSQPLQWHGTQPLLLPVASAATAAATVASATAASVRLLRARQYVRVLTLCQAIPQAIRIEGGIFIELSFSLCADCAFQRSHTQRLHLLPGEVLNSNCTIAATERFSKGPLVSVRIVFQVSAYRYPSIHWSGRGRRTRG